jgi:hypothetical protein
VLGLGASATQAEVFEAAEGLGLAGRLGVEKRLETDLAWLGEVSRGEVEVRDALGRLSDPPRRAAERLFWFHTPLAVPRPASVEGLRGAAGRILERGGAAARHDAALFLLAALHALDTRLEERELWAEAFRLWREEVEAEEFWSSLVAADLRGEYEQVLTFAEAAELRLRTPRLVSQALAGVAVEEAAHENHAGVGRVLAVLRDARLPRPLLEEYENEALGPLEERAERVCDASFGFVSLMAHGTSLPPSELKERHYDPAVYRFCSEAKPELFKFLDAAGADSYHLRRLTRHAAERLGELAGYYRKDVWTEQAVYLYRTARALAPDDSAELAASDAALREMGGGEKIETTEYVVRLARELSDLRPPSKLFKAPPAAYTAKGDPTFKGCGWQIALFVVAVISCFVLDKCGVIKMGRRSSYPPAFNFNYNYNQRVPVPQFSPVPIPLPHVIPANKPAPKPRPTPSRRRRATEKNVAPPARNGRN